MATYVRTVLSGSTDGRGIKVVAVATPGTLIHTAVASATNMDEVWLWAVNNDTVERILTIEFGGVTSPDDLIACALYQQDGPILVVPGLVLRNTLVIRAFAAAANIVTIFGYVNRITF